MITSHQPSDQARSKIAQVFRYLQALNQLRNPVQREISNQPWVMRFLDLPDHPCIRFGTVPETASETDEDGTPGTKKYTEGEYILKVRRPKLTNPPEPPREIVPWLQKGWQNIDGKVSIEPIIQTSAGGQPQVFRFEDEPRRQRLLEEWTNRRNTWVESERPVRIVMTIYERLYALQAQIERETERLELMLGDGLLTWHPQNGTTVHHPVLLLRLQLHFDPEIPEFTLLETGQPSELYTAILQTMPDIKPAALGRCREDLEQNDWHPLGGEETNSFLRRLISQISPYGELVEQIPSDKQKNIPYITRDPVIFLRPRTLGIGTALEAILETLPVSNSFPSPLVNLVGVETYTNAQQAGEISVSIIDAPNGEDENILLSKPANAEQLEIARRLEKYGAVLVQGPPGTGKTHTIANLIGHLLAQGKRVLVTSEKPKALRVLREKVVGPLQSLCVSMLEDDNREEMKRTIEDISERLAFADADKLEREAALLTRQRIEVLNQLQKTRQQLLEARGGEYRDIVLAGETYQPSDAARYVAQEKQAAAWIPSPMTPGAALPLSVSELIDLYNSNIVITADDEREMALYLPETGRLITPIDFERLLAEQYQLRQENLNYRRDLWNEGSWNKPPEEIQGLQHYLIKEAEQLRNITGWRLAAIAAGREGGPRRQAWDDLLNEVLGVYSLAAQAQLLLLKYDPVLAEDCLPGHIEKVIDEIIEYLAGGGKLNGLKLLTKREWKTLIESAKVKGQQPELLEHFKALYYLVRLRTARSDLVGRWQRQMAVLGAPDATSLGPAPESTLYQYVDQLRYCLQWYSNILAPLENGLRNQGFQWDRFLSETPANHAPYGDILRLSSAVVEQLPALLTAEFQRRSYIQKEEPLLNWQRYLEQIGSSSTGAQVVQQLKEAVTKRDPHAYREAFASLSSLHVKREVFQLRRTLLSRLEQVAPGWAAVIRDRVGIHGKRELPGDPRQAWLWRQLNDELEQRAKTSLVELQERIVHLSAELYRITAELVEKKAWAAQVRHTTSEQRRALQGWGELTKKVGKGTGKRAPRLLAQARELMPTCQSAVPVWIMPLSYVARNFDMKRNHFDVVIIDEASQADIMALIAVYMGSQIVVVGDDEQVSPVAVGQNLDEVQHLIDEYLENIPQSQLYDGKSSIYGLAKLLPSGLVCLREHFRCVPDIIQFSNDLSYDGKIKPLRDDSEVHRRPFTVEYRVRSFNRKGKVNQEEALTVASLLVAAAEQPEYGDATFGVISMVGNDQAMYIQTLLHRYLPATEYIKRRVLCGDPAQFQGDERDVMFLSMVDIPGEGEGPLRLRAEEGHDDMFKKRFNVAASRARDQMWVVHSLDPDIDLKDQDIRKRLILHARNPVAVKHQIDQEVQKVESEFEKQVFHRLRQAGYRVTTQWPVGAYRIDMVVEGNGKRLAVECDGDRWHTPEKLEEDMARQAILERLGWRFVRIRGSQFFRDPEKALEIVFSRLHSLEIPPEGLRVLESAQNDDGKELKGRIIRRADELRRQWAESGEESIIQLPPVRQTRSTNGRSEENTIIPRVTLSQQAYKSIPEVKRDTATALQTNVSKASRPDEYTRAGHVEPQALHQGTSEKNIAIDLAAFLQRRGLTIIDKRISGGCLWVMGGPELSQMMQSLRAKGINFNFTPNGGQATDYKAAWFTKFIEKKS